MLLVLSCSLSNVQPSVVRTETRLEVYISATYLLQLHHKKIFDIKIMPGTSTADKDDLMFKCQLYLFWKIEHTPMPLFRPMLFILNQNAKT